MSKKTKIYNFCSISSNTVALRNIVDISFSTLIVLVRLSLKVDHLSRSTIFKRISSFTSFTCNKKCATKVQKKQTFLHIIVNIVRGVQFTDSLDFQWESIQSSPPSNPKYSTPEFQFRPNPVLWRGASLDGS